MRRTDATLVATSTLNVSDLVHRRYHTILGTHFSLLRSGRLRGSHKRFKMQVKCGMRCGVVLVHGVRTERNLWPNGVHFQNAKAVFIYMGPHYRSFDAYFCCNKCILVTRRLHTTSCYCCIRTYSLPPPMILQSKVTILARAKGVYLFTPRLECTCVLSPHTVSC